MDLVLALATSLAGVAVLYASWRRTRGGKWVTIPAGWMLLGLSMAAWIRFGGGEFGTAYEMMAVSFVAWGFVALSRETRRSGDRRRQLRTPAVAPGRSAALRTLARVVVVVPLAGTASALAGVAVAAILPWGTTDRYVFALIAVPILWGGLSIWTGLTEKLSRAALVLAGVSVACSVLLFAR
jgi:hypothetical protein